MCSCMYTIIIVHSWWIFKQVTRDKFIWEAYMLRDDIIIRKAIIHILDTFVGMPVISDRELECEPDLYDFFRGHLEKITSSDDIKNCRFNADADIPLMLEGFTSDSFVMLSQHLAALLYKVMAANVTIPPADLAVLLFRYKEQDYIGLLKMNYKSSYTHSTVSDLGENSNEIILQKALLPSETQRINEAAVIRLDDMDILLLEKKYEVNGTKTNYLSQIFLKCSAPLSQKSRLGIVTKAVEQVSDKYYDREDATRKMEVKKIIHEELAQQGVLDVNVIKEKVFKDNEDMQKDFDEKLEKYHLIDTKIQPQNKTTTKRFERQYLRTDTGIEITIPMDQYGNNENVEFITNPDGTISVMIKNIGKLTSN